MKKSSPVMKVITLDTFDDLHMRVGRIRRLSDLVRCLSDSRKIVNDELTDDAQSAVGDIAEIIRDDAEAITRALAPTGGAR